MDLESWYRRYGESVYRRCLRLCRDEHHGDAHSLHLGGSRLVLRELDQLLQDTRVATLVTVIDACRDERVAGVRAKGARHDKPFDIQLWRESGRIGRVTITSAGYNEGRLGSPTVARSGVAWGGGARAAWDLPRLRLLGEAQLSAASAANEILAKTYLETRLGLGAGSSFSLSPLEIHAGATFGVLWVHARATRIARDDAVEVLGVPRYTSSNAFGPYLAPSLSVELPLGRFVAALQTELQLSAIRVDAELVIRGTPGVSLALGRRF